jgi:hypothetical protein
VNSELTGITTLALTQAVTIFHQFLPPLTDVRKTSMDDVSGRLDVRIGEIASAALVVGVGAILAYMVKTKEPFVVSIITAIGLVGIYEYVLRCNSE